MKTGVMDVTKELNQFRYPISVACEVLGLKVHSVTFIRAYKRA